MDQSRDEGMQEPGTAPLQNRICSHSMNYNQPRMPGLYMSSSYLLAGFIAVTVMDLPAFLGSSG